MTRTGIIECEYYRIYREAILPEFDPCTTSWFTDINFPGDAQTFNIKEYVGIYVPVNAQECRELSIYALRPKP